MNINTWRAICIELIIYILLFVTIRYFRMKCANHLPKTLFTFLGSSTRNLILLFSPGNTNCNVHKVGRWGKDSKNGFSMYQINRRYFQNVLESCVFITLPCALDTVLYKLNLTPHPQCQTGTSAFGIIYVTVG